VRRLSASCSSCSSQVLSFLPFDPFGRWIFGAQGLADGLWVEYGRSVRGERFVSAFTTHIVTNSEKREKEKK
jgi:hypothetical protein